MKFFNEYEKMVAMRNSRNVLKKKYRESEKQLLKASKTGSETMIAKAMESHKTFEYALMYQKTPEFKQRKQS